MGDAPLSLFALHAQGLAGSGLERARCVVLAELGRGLVAIHGHLQVAHIDDDGGAANDALAALFLPLGQAAAIGRGEVVAVGVQVAVHVLAGPCGGPGLDGGFHFLRGSRLCGLLLIDGRRCLGRLGGGHGGGGGRGGGGWGGGPCGGPGRGPLPRPARLPRPRGPCPVRPELPFPGPAWPLPPWLPPPWPGPAWLLQPWPRQPWLPLPWLPPPWPGRPWHRRPSLQRP